MRSGPRSGRSLRTQEEYLYHQGSLRSPVHTLPLPTPWAPREQKFCALVYSIYLVNNQEVEMKMLYASSFQSWLEIDMTGLCFSMLRRQALQQNHCGYLLHVEVPEADSPQGGPGLCTCSKSPRWFSCILNWRTAEWGKGWCNGNSSQPELTFMSAHSVCCYVKSSQWPRVWDIF